jgi:hypothetical protein
MLRSIYGAKNRSKKRSGGPPRTIQEAAEAFIAHVKEMEAGLKLALQKGAFDVRYVGDLDKLVPVVERAFDHAISAMDARVTLMRLVSDLPHRLRAELEKNEDVTLVTLGELKQETDEAVYLLRLEFMRYQSMLTYFVMEIMGSGLRYESESDSENEFYFGSARPPHDPRELPHKINEKLDDAVRKLGTCLSSSQVVAAYAPGSEHAAKERNSATQLARLLCDRYYNRFRERLVAFLERQSRLDTIEISLMDAITPSQKEDGINQAKEDKRKKLESVDNQFRVIKSNLRVMEIKDRINELERRADGWDDLPSTGGKVAVLESYTGRVSGLCKTFVKFTENDVTRLIDELSDTKRHGGIGSHIMQLIRHIKSHTESIGRSLILKAHDVAKKLEAAIESAKREEEREKEREAARNDTDGSDDTDGTDEPKSIREIRELGVYYDTTVIPQLNKRLSKQTRTTTAPNRHNSALASGSSIQESADLLLRHTSALEAEVSAYKTSVGSVSTKDDLDLLVTQAIDICSSHLFRAMDEFANLVRLVIVWFTKKYPKESMGSDEDYGRKFIGTIRNYDKKDNKSFLLYDLVQSNEISVVTMELFEILLKKYKKGGEGANDMDSIAASFMKSAAGVFQKQITTGNTTTVLSGLIIEEKLFDYLIHLYENQNGRWVLNEFDEKLRKITRVVGRVFPALTHTAITGAFNIPDFSRDTEHAVANIRSDNKWRKIKINVEEMKENGSDPLKNLGGFYNILGYDVNHFIDELIQLLKSNHGKLTPGRSEELKEPFKDMVVYLPNAYDALKRKAGSNAEVTKIKEIKEIKENIDKRMEKIKAREKEVELAEKEAKQALGHTILVFGRNQTNRQHGTRFGRYVHRVAKHSARVPHRAWSA